MTQLQWKSFYREYKLALTFSWDAAQQIRTLMFEYRREAALERIIARQAREIERLRNNLAVETSDSNYWFDKWADVVEIT